MLSMRMELSMDQVIKRCGICGEKPTYSEHVEIEKMYLPGCLRPENLKRRIYLIECKSCSFGFSSMKSKEEAIGLWNTSCGVDEGY